MRAVKTVIAVAGNLKREQRDMEEAQICLRALRDVNVPKFLKDDLKLFNGKPAFQCSIEGWEQTLTEKKLFKSIWRITLKLLEIIVTIHQC